MLLKLKKKISEWHQEIQKQEYKSNVLPDFYNNLNTNSSTKI